MESRKLVIALGPSVHSKKFVNTELTWDDLTAQFRKAKSIDQTHDAYMHLSLDEQAALKDITCFVGGGLGKTNGPHTKENVLWRDLVTLDADRADLAAVADWTLSFGGAYCIYSTLKHTLKAPRLRIIIPLSRRVTPDEWCAISRMIAKDLGMEMIDPASFKVSQPMYMPEHCADVQPYYDVQYGEFVNADDVLSRYPAGWERQEDWPTSAREEDAVKRSVKKVADPLAKDGLIGAFNRTYTISEAIDKFIPEVYKRVNDSRYTYTGGTTAGGAVVYEDDHILYSNHATDPAGGRAQNAYDLIRIHKFGGLDLPGSSKASNKAMLDFINTDADTLKTAHIERYRQGVQDFDGNDNGPVTAQNEAETEGSSVDLDWVAELQTNKDGNPTATIDNVHTILVKDTNLSGIGGMNELSQLYTMAGPVPWNKSHKAGDCWSDADEAGLRWYIEKVYHIQGRQRISDALTQVQSERAFHPVRAYLNGLTWDGVERLDSLLIDYLGAEDTPYVRAVTRKQFVAAVYRVMDPGHKFDQMLTLVGPQGIGKSTLIAKMGQAWYTDTVNSISGKDGYDAIQGAWIVEMSELAGLRKAEVEAVKQFISKCVDTYRRAYAKNTIAYPRQCVFFGSTNDDELLRDQTGNRRFWVVETGRQPHTKYAWNMTQEEVDQLWAEAVVRWKAHESLYLDADRLVDAEALQETHMQSDARLGMIQQYLDILLPDDWEDRNVENRRDYINQSMVNPMPGASIKRDRVCAAEVLCELFGKDRGDIKRADTVEINGLINLLPDWIRYKKASGYMRFKLYGVQKAFVKDTESPQQNDGSVVVSAPEEDEF